MMKALTLEEMEAVKGGWTMSGWRQFVLACSTIYGAMHGLSLQQIQDGICKTDEERKFVKEVYEDFMHGR